MTPISDLTSSLLCLITTIDKRTYGNWQSTSTQPKPMLESIHARSPTLSQPRKTDLAQKAHAESAFDFYFTWDGGLCFFADVRLATWDICVTGFGSCVFELFVLSRVDFFSFFSRGWGNSLSLNTSKKCLQD